MNVVAPVLPLPADVTALVKTYLTLFDDRVGEAVAKSWRSAMRTGAPGEGLLSMVSLTSDGHHDFGATYVLYRGQNILGKSYADGSGPAPTLAHETKIDLGIPSHAAPFVATRQVVIHVEDNLGGLYVWAEIHPTFAGTEIIYGDGDDVRLRVDADSFAKTGCRLAKLETGNVVVLDPGPPEHFAYKVVVPDEATVAALKSLAGMPESDDESSESSDSDFSRIFGSVY